MRELSLKWKGFANPEVSIFKRLNSPKKIQDFLDTLEINFESRGETIQSPLRVLESRRAHCLEGAILAAAILEFHGHKPLLMDLRARHPDDDHVVSLFRQDGFWGAISKTNHAVLRFREPVYKTLRELALSFFHEYFDNFGRKNLREYSAAVNLNQFNNLDWRTSEKNLWAISKGLNRAKHFWLLNLRQARGLRRADPIEVAASKLLEWRKSGSGARKIKYHNQ